MSSIRKYASNVLFIKDHKVEHIGMEGVDMYLESLGAQ
jgi:hypothetical protein